MTKKPKTSKDAADKVVKNIRRKTRQRSNANIRAITISSQITSSNRRLNAELSNRISHKWPERLSISSGIQI